MFRRYLSLNPQLRLALILWAALAVALCVKIIRQDRLCSATGREDVRHSVYSVFAAASRHWWRDQPLYADYIETEGIDGYRYSPAFATAFTPLALLPAWLGAAGWGLLSIGALVAALLMFFRDVLQPFTMKGDSPIFAETKIGTVPETIIEHQDQKNEGVFLSLALAGSVIGLWSGQSNALMLAMILMGLSAIARRHWWAASWWLAVPVFIKLWPAALVLILVYFWPRQLIGRFAAACATLTLMPFLTRPPGTVWWQYIEWYKALTGPLQGRWPGYRDAWTVWEQAASLLRLDAGAAAFHHAYAALQLLAAAAVFVWCVRQRRREPFDARLLMSVFSMWAAWQLLFGPGTEQLTYGLIAPTAAWAVVTSFAERKARCWTAVACGIAALLPSGDIEKAILCVFPGGEAILPLSIAMLAGWLVWHEQ
jgi:hypothetical protein